MKLACDNNMNKIYKIGFTVSFSLILVLGIFSAIFVYNNNFKKTSNQIVKEINVKNITEELKKQKNDEEIRIEQEKQKNELDNFLLGMVKNNVVVDKYYKINPNSYLVGIKIQSNYHFIYEVLNIDTVNKTIKLVGGYDVSDCSSIEFSEDGDDFKVSHMTSPCEAGATYNTYLFDKYGYDKYSIRYSTFEKSFSFVEGQGNVKHNVKLLFNDKKCESDKMFESENDLPYTNLIGVYLDDKLFSFENSSVRCRMEYGGGVGYPIVSQPYIKDDKVLFQLPNLQQAEINLKNEPLKIEIK